MTASFLQWYIVKLQETKLLLIIDTEEKSGNVSKMSLHAGTAEAVKWFAIYFSPTLTFNQYFSPQECDAVAKLEANFWMK